MSTNEAVLLQYKADASQAVAETKRAGQSVTELAATAKAASAAMARALSDERAALSAMFNERQRVAAADQEAAKQAEHLAEQIRKQADAIKSAEAAASPWGKTLGELSQRMDTFEVGGLKVTNIMGGLKTLAVGAAAGLAAFSGAVGYGIAQMVESEDAARRLSVALNAQGALTQGNVAAFAAMASQIQDTTRYSGDMATAAQTLGLQLGVPATRVREFTAASADLADQLGIGLNDAAKLLGQTMDGTAGKLAQQVPAVAALTEAQLRNGDAIKVVAGLYGGTAAGGGGSITGALAMFRNAVDDAAKSLAVGVTGTGNMADAIGKARQFVVDITPQIEELGRTIGRVAGAAMDAARALGFLFETGQSDAARNNAPNAMLEKAQDDVTATKRLLAEQRALLAEQQSAPVGQLDVSRAQSQLAPGAKLGSAYGDASAQAEDVLRTTRNIAALTGELERNQQKADDVKVALAGMTAEQRAAGVAAVDVAKVTAGSFTALADGADAAAEAAAKAAAAMAARVDAVQSAAGIAALEVELVGRVVATEAERQVLLDGIVSRLESAKGEAWELARAGEMTDLAYRATVDALDQQIAQQRELIAISEEKAIADQLAREAAVAGLPGGDGEADDGTSQVEVDQVAMIAATEAAAARDREIEQLAGLVVSLGDVNLARAEQAILQAEATLQHDIETGALDALTAAGGREIAMRQRAIGAMKQQVGQQREAVRWANLSKVAKMQENLADISGALSSVAAVTKSTKAKIAIQATQSVISGILQTAEAAASVAKNDYVGAAAHALSAATFFYAATQAGKGGGGGAASSGGGGGGGESSPRGGSDDFQSTRTRAGEGQRMPAISVVFTGNGIIAGTTPEAFAASITPFIQEVAREAGGRDSSVRG